MGKKQRAKMARLAQQKPIQPTQFQKVKLFLARNKKRIATYGTIAALVGSTFAYREKIPYITGMNKSTHLGILFAQHQHQWDAAHVKNELIQAREKGIPYHLMLVEASGVAKEDLVKNTIEWNKRLDLMRNDIHNLTASGMKKIDAINKVRNHYRKFASSDYAAEIFLALAVEGVRMMPAEGYSKKNIEQIRELDTRLNVTQGELQKAMNSNAPMNQLQQKYQATSKIYRELADIREKPTIANMKENIAQARKLFPELKNEKEIRVLSQFGTFHKDGMNPTNFNGRTIEAHEVSPIKGFSLADFAARRSNTTANYQEFASRFETLALYLDEPLREMMHGNTAKNIPNNPRLAEEMFNQAKQTSQKEFEELSKKTQGLSYNERANYLLTYYLAKAQKQH